MNKKYYETRRKELNENFEYIKADLQELAEYYMPRAVRFLCRNANKARAKSKKIKVSTPTIALRNFSSGMMSGATSPALRWFKLGIRDSNLRGNYDVKAWCAKVENLFRDILISSNFYTILPSVYKQLGVFSFSAIALEGDEDTIMNCKLLPIGSYRYAKDEKGRIDTFVREFMDTAKNIVSRFGENNVSDAVKDALKNNPEREFQVVHFVEPNKNYKKNSPLFIMK